MCTRPLLRLMAHSDHCISLSSPRECGDSIVTILGREMGTNVKPEDQERASQAPVLREGLHALLNASLGSG